MDSIIDTPSATVALGQRAGPPGATETKPTRPRTVSIGTVLTVTFTPLIIISVLATLSMGLYFAYANTRDQLADEVRLTLGSVEAEIHRQLGTVETAMAFVRRQLEAGAVDVADMDALSALLAAALATSPQVVGAAMIWPDGTADLIGREEGQVRREDWSARKRIQDLIREARTSPDMFWSEPIWNDYLQTGIVVLNLPLQRDGELLGVIGPAVRIADLSRFVAELSAEIGQTVFILSDRDRVLAHPSLTRGIAGLSEGHPLPALSDLDDEILTNLRAGRADRIKSLGSVDEGEGWTVEGPQGEHTVLVRAVAGYGPAPWLVGTYSPGLLLERERTRLWLTGLIGILILGAAVLAARLIGKDIACPVLRLADAAAQIGAKPLDQVSPVQQSRIREIDDAGRAINRMVVDLQDRQRLRDLFGRYVPEAVVRQILSDPKAGALGGERRWVTLLFTDIEGYTAVAEAAPAEELVALLNAYLEEVCTIITDHGGIVVDFIGDAVFALFGAPVSADDHAARALAAAEAVGRFGTAFAQGERGGRPGFGYTRIGVHTGVAVIGNVGSSQRLKFGATGDAVNTAARLEQANKRFGTQLLMSEATATDAGLPATRYRPVGSLLVHGRKEPIDVAEYLPEGADDPTDYRAAFNLLATDPEQARRAFGRLRQAHPDDRLIAFHWDRLSCGQASDPIVMDAS